MSRFHGLLLFDIADPPIGQWEENLGTRGMFDEWKTKDKRYFLRIEADEDCCFECKRCKGCRRKPENCDCQEVWVADNETGNHDSFYFGPYEDALQEAKQFMRDNPRGWE